MITDGTIKGLVLTTMSLYDGSRRREEPAIALYMSDSLGNEMELTFPISEEGGAHLARSIGHVASYSKISSFIQVNGTFKERVKHNLDILTGPLEGRVLTYVEFR